MDVSTFHVVPLHVVKPVRLWSYVVILVIQNVGVCPNDGIRNIGLIGEVKSSVATDYQVWLPRKAVFYH